VLMAGCQTTQQMCGKVTGWMPLFDGKSLEGWKASENKDTFTFRDGMIVSLFSLAFQPSRTRTRSPSATA